MVSLQSMRKNSDCVWEPVCKRIQKLYLIENVRIILWSLLDDCVVFFVFFLSATNVTYLLLLVIAATSLPLDVVIMSLTLTFWTLIYEPGGGLWTFFVSNDWIFCYSFLYLLNFSKNFFPTYSIINLSFLGGLLLEDFLKFYFYLVDRFQTFEIPNTNISWHKVF